ncbi:MAG: fibronectin type III domain-containing protein [Gemmatimonadota bacterium]|nr:fibronectin type III domain-containing protein [Gemmatimonadota bacterium]
MISNQPGLTGRSLLAAAAICAILMPWAEVRAEEPSAGDAREGAPPTASLTRTFTGTVHEEFRIDIRFSQDVTGFEIGDIQMAYATAVPPLVTHSASHYSLGFTTDPGHAGRVTITIPSGVAQNSIPEGNRETRLSFLVDNKAPEVVVARINGDQVDIVFDESLDESAVPAVSDFSVSFTMGSDYDTRTVSGVDVSANEVFLRLESPVELGAEVEVYYEDTGANALRDRVGNLVFGGAWRAINVTGSTPTGVPGAPRDLRAVADGPDAIELTWVEPDENGGREITGYLIEESTDAGDNWSDLEPNTRNADTSYRHAGLSGGVTRHYRVSAINFNGTGDPSDVAHATTEDVLPDAPLRLTARARGTSEIVLNWSPPTSSGSSQITGYWIQRCSSTSATGCLPTSPSGTGGWITLVADTESRATSYTHRGLRPGITRHYRVAARNRAGWSEWSNIAEATIEPVAPGAPTRLTVTPSPLGGSTQLDLAWSAPSEDGGSDITGYLIEWSATRAGPWVPLVTDTESVVRSYTDRGLSPNTTRFYRVSAINGKGPGRPSNVAQGTTNAAPPGPPQNVRARSTGPKSILLAWDPPESDRGARVTSYAIQRIGPGDDDWITHRANTGTTATTFTDTGLEPVTRYQYRVAAINREGTGEFAPRPPALPATAITHADKAGAPTGLTAKEIGTSRIDLVWNAPRYTGGVSIIGYRVEASDDEGATWNIIRRNTNSTATTFSDVNLQPATTRHYRVAAINLAGPGAWSNTARATTDATLPGVPRRLSAEAVGTSQITLSWQAPSDDGGARVTGYRIEVSADGGGSWEDLVGNTRTTATVYTHSGLAPASTRHYRVSAVNRVGVGNASRVAGSTTDATVPDAPTGLVANDVTPTQIDLFWIAPAYNGGARITGYRIEVSEDAAVWADLVTNTESTVTAFSHTGLLPGSTRHYRVSAMNRAGTGAASVSVSAATDDPVQRAGRLNTRVLPHVAAAMMSSTVSAIAGRIDAVARGMGMERRVETNGLSSMAASLSAPGAGGLGLAQGDQAGLAALFGGTSFQMPFGASDAQQQSATGTQLASWGAGEYHHLGEPGATSVDWKGNMVSAHAGVDVRVGSDILAGVAGSYSSGSFDFTDRTGASAVTGTYGTSMASVHPYVAWFSGAPGTSVWGSAGFGRGDVEVDDVREGLRTSPASMLAGAGGASYQLLARGSGGVRLKAEGWAGQVMVDGSEQIEEVTLSMQRGKLALELTQALRADAGQQMAFVLEGGMRYDNGDGVNGASAEVGGGLRYTNSGLGLTAEGRGRFVISAHDGYEEWGLGGTLMFDPAARGEGLSIRVAPSYGDHTSGVNQLWERGVYDAVGGHDPGMNPNVNGEVAYGIAGFQGTPFSGFYLAESGMRAFSSGVRYDLGADVGLRLEGTRRESGLGGARHSVGVRGRIRFR